MTNHGMIRGNFVRLAVILMLCSRMTAAQGRATLHGQVTDQLGGVIAGVSVTLVSDAGKEQVAGTDGQGVYRFGRLTPGTYRLRAVHRGFATYERASLSLTEGYAEPVDFKLVPTTDNQESTISGNGLVRAPVSSKDTLSDKADFLAAALRSLAGPAAGPAGAEIRIDAFTSGVPIRSDKQAIREIVINRNPFSAENDRIGYLRSEALTKPGTGSIHGGADLNFSDNALNSRNPFADMRPSTQRRTYAGNVSGPLASNKASFFLSANRRALDEHAVINATVLDDALNVTNLRQVAPTPERYLLLNTRLDVRLNENNTLGASYVYDWYNQPNAGLGGLRVPSRAERHTGYAQQFTLTETSVLSPRAVNEARLQYFQLERNTNSDPASGSFTVFGAFIGGGSDDRRVSYVQRGFELHDYTTITTGRHSLRFGGRLRAAWISDFSDVAGLHIFSGRVAPELDQQNRIVFEADGQPKLTFVNSIEIYRRTLLFQRLGLPPSQIRAMGGGAAQFIIPIGNPLTGLTQMDFGGFIQDDLKLRPDFALSVGLRYQNQTNAHGNLNFAPRAAFAWTPWARSTGQPRTVIRGGAGIFYDWVQAGTTLSINRLNGINQKQFHVTDPTALDLFPNAPSSAFLESLPQTIWRKAPDFGQPYIMQSSISIEQSLPHRIVLTASYLYARGFHRHHARNINTPLPGSGVRPFGNSDNIFEFESDGIYKHRVFIVNASARPNPRLTLSASYALGYRYSDTDGSHPANPYDLRADYGRAASDLRHRFILNGTINMPRGINLHPVVQAQSGPPFDITTGIDHNNDTRYFDRPAFATDLSKPSVIITPFGAFDVSPDPGDRIIPRNFGQNPGYFSINLRLGKTFVIGGEARASATSQPNSQVGQRSYRLTVALDAVNLLNRTNAGGLIEMLSSPQFGMPNRLRHIGQSSPSSNRSLNLVMSFNF